MKFNFGNKERHVWVIAWLKYVGLDVPSLMKYRFNLFQSQSHRGGTAGCYIKLN